MKSFVAALHLAAAAIGLALAVAYSITVPAPAFDQMAGAVHQLERFVFTPVTLASTGVLLEVLIRVGEKRERGLGQLAWSNSYSRVLLVVGAITLAVSSATYVFAFWRQIGVLGAFSSVLFNPLSLLAWGAAIEYLDRIAGRLNSPSAKGAFAWAPRALLVIAAGVLVATAPFYYLTLRDATLPGMQLAQGESVVSYVFAWLVGPVQVLGWAGVLEQVLRIASGLARQPPAASAD